MKKKRSRGKRSTNLRSCLGSSAPFVGKNCSKIEISPEGEGEEEGRWLPSPDATRTIFIAEAPRSGKIPVADAPC